MKTAAGLLIDEQRLLIAESMHVLVFKLQKLAIVCSAIINRNLCSLV